MGLLICEDTYASIAPPPPHDDARFFVVARRVTGDIMGSPAVFGPDTDAWSEHRAVFTDSLTVACLWAAAMTALHDEHDTAGPGLARITALSVRPDEDPLDDDDALEDGPVVAYVTASGQAILTGDPAFDEIDQRCADWPETIHSPVQPGRPD